MFDANDWIGRFVRAGRRMEVDGLTIRPHGRVSAECLDIWNEITGSAEPEKTRWNAVEAEIRGRVGDVGPMSAIFPDDARG